VEETRSGALHLQRASAWKEGTEGGMEIESLIAHSFFSFDRHRPGTLQQQQHRSTLHINNITG